MTTPPIADAPLAQPGLPVAAPRILIVCTGNICRSPLAEQLLRASLSAAGIDAVVTSAGTRAMTGSAMTPEAAVLSTQYGAASTDHIARQLTEQLIAGADLVLTATRDHRREVVTLLPKATRYTFTLNQFARLVANEPIPAPDAAPRDAQTSRDSAPLPLVEISTSSIQGPVNETAIPAPQPASATRPSRDFPAYIASVAATRGLQPSPNPPTRDDVEDPYRQSAAVYARAAAAINSSVTTITAALVAARD
ncbi:hypothetical protein [Cryobacterium sp. Y11]|uniref:arsenate reductase/protein-tyrosine-phosphatase family protein n=1 Tax=Cryobacterium sp. Y11 TaxID=2045016 RepID=UPI000CE4EC89|nr:hypothetical protein [Cryobacterium sp. Y11]